MADKSAIENTLRINLEFSTGKWNQQVKGAANQLNTLNKRVNLTEKNLGKASKAATGFGNAMQFALGFLGTRALLDNALAFDRADNRMRAATESLEEFNKASKLANNLARELGVSTLSASRGYATLIAATRGSGIEGEGTERLFKSILSTSAALSLTADETNSVLLAFSQVASKGRAAAEEIRGQIGERIPGFFLKLADSIGVTTKELSKMLDEGLLTSDIALEASARALESAFGEAAQDNAASLTANVTRLADALKIVASETIRIAKDFVPIFQISNEIIGRYGDVNRLAVENSELFSRQLAQIRREQEEANNAFKEGNTTLDERNERLRDLSEIVKNVQLGGQDILKFSGQLSADDYIQIQRLITELNTDIELGYEKATDSRIDDETRLADWVIRENKRAQKERIKAIEDYEKKRFNLEQKRRDAQQSRREFFRQVEREATERAVDENIAILKNSISELNAERESLLNNQYLSPEEANQVSFIEAVSSGGIDDIRKNIEAESREIGATKGDVNYAKEQLNKLTDIDSELKSLNERLENLETV